MITFIYKEANKVLLMIILNLFVSEKFFSLLLFVLYILQFPIYLFFKIAFLALVSLLWFLVLLLLFLDKIAF